MDAQTLSNLFATTFNPDPNVRKVAELDILKLGGQEGMITAVLQLIGNNAADLSVRQAAAVYIKNRVHRSYNADTPRTRGDPAIPISDRAALKASLIPLLVSSPNANISVQLSNALKSVISNDFPELWPELLDAVRGLLSSEKSEELIAGCRASLEIIRVLRYRSPTKLEVLFEVTSILFPQLVTIALRLMSTNPSGPSQEIPLLLHLILKTYKTSILLTLSKHQQSHDSLVPWGRLLFQVVNFVPPKEGVPDDLEEREKCEWWKAKKWAYGILGRLFHRYGNPSQLPSVLKKDYSAFANHFVSNFAPEIIKMYLQQVELYVSGHAWLSNKCQYQIFTFFTECIKPKSTWFLLKPHIQSLVSSFVFPQFVFGRERQELWEDDKIEYTRVTIDEFDDFTGPVSAAITFLHSLVNNRTKTTFMPILSFINNVLESNPNQETKFGALTMTSALSGFIMRHPEMKKNMEQFVIRHVIPEFSSPNGWMRAAAAEVIGTLEKMRMPWSNPENLTAAARAVASAMDDPDLPVRIHAAIALTNMIPSHAAVKDAVKPQVEKVVTDLLKLTEETDLDILSVSLDTMVEEYTQELLPVATQLAARLRDSYMRLAQEIVVQENALNDDGVMDVGDLNNVDDDKSFAAMNIARTITTVIASVDNAPEILAQVEEVIIPMILFTQENKMLDMLDTIYELVDSLTYKLRRISPGMWPVFEASYRLFKSDAIDFLEEMLPSLDNFLSYGADVIKARDDYKLMVLDIYTHAMTNDHLGDNDRVNACKLIESYLLNLRGAVDQSLAPIVATAIDHLEKANTRSLKLSNVEVIVNTILYNPTETLRIMEANHPSVARAFFDKWFALIHEDKGLPRVHDKKLSIAAICALLDVDPAVVPASLREGWVGMVKAALLVFADLPRAVEARKALEDTLDEEDDEEIDDSAALNLDDDDEGDVWDEDSEYIEMLAKQGAELRKKAESGADDDDDDDESDDESIDEELGYLSPLDNIDPYITFKNALASFQGKNGEMYQAATTSLSMVEQTQLMELMVVADRNATAGSSKSA